MGGIRGWDLRGRVGAGRHAAAALAPAGGPDIATPSVQQSSFVTSAVTPRFGSRPRRCKLKLALLLLLSPALASSTLAPVCFPAFLLLTRPPPPAPSPTLCGLCASISASFRVRVSPLPSLPASLAVVSVCVYCAPLLRLLSSPSSAARCIPPVFSSGSVSSAARVIGLEL